MAETYLYVIPIQTPIHRHKKDPDTFNINRGMDVITKMDSIKMASALAQ